MEHATDAKGQREYIKLAHAIRFHLGESGTIPGRANDGATARRLYRTMPASMPRGATALAQGHWLLWSDPMPPLADVYRTVWTEILKEEVTDRPVINR